MKNFVVGANKEGYHYINVNFEDLNYDIVGDISNVVEGDICPHCGGHIKFSKGIEIGNTFKLGKHYCEDCGCEISEGAIKCVSCRNKEKAKRIEEIWSGEVYRRNH